jgi:hypothetical protein
MRMSVPSGERSNNRLEDRHDESDRLLSYSIACAILPRPWFFNRPNWADTAVAERRCRASDLSLLSF